MRAFGDGPHNFKPWSSDVDDTRVGTPFSHLPCHTNLAGIFYQYLAGIFYQYLAGIFFEIHSSKIYDSTGSVMSILAGKANSFVADITFSAASVFSGLQRLSFLSPKNS
ncbi:hypothetical protein TNCV_941251 [Trichonephila clavipes]|nr:hypothetical protein TNCV_941251 [Trichonephila clavipes]